MISDINYDCFKLSMDHVDKRILDYRFQDFPNKAQISRDAFEIRLNFINMIDDIVCGRFGTFENIEQESKVDKVVTFMCKMLEDYLSESSEKEQDYFYRQLALGESNVVPLVLEVVNILILLGKKMPLRLLLSKLVKICKDNKITQS
jgi:hypothetical protein